MVVSCGSDDEGIGRDLLMFDMNSSEQSCYDRVNQPYTSVVDIHYHAQPFGGTSVPYEEQLTYFDRTDTRFVVLYGIGQTLPYDSGCDYYLDCLGTEAAPSLKNDFENAANYMEHPRDDIDFLLSMSFPDLANPGDIADKIFLLDAEYPGLFKWMGEVNLHKEALRGNGHEPATLEDIAAWSDFMAILLDRDIPIAIHSDLGDDDDATKHRYLMQEVLRLYPNNKIVWVHMGLSRELVTMDVDEHITVMSEELDANPNLYLDISWSVISDHYYDTDVKRAKYVDFYNKYPTRIISGTDFVASSNKTYGGYDNELELTSSILNELDDEAFRRIALGQNYFDLAPGLAEKFQAPEICR